MYENLFSPMKIGNCEIPNRLVVTAMVTNYCTEDGMITDRFIKYHEEKAKGGWGLIVTEDYAINENGKGYTSIPGLYDDEQILGNKRLVDTIHQYNTKIFCQIYHPGRQSNHFVNGGVQPVAPSPIPCPWLKEIPRELTIEEIHTLVSQFGDTALRAKKSGFDGVEVHIAHGYLLLEFLSPFTNKRTDEYGGCFANRVRIIKEVYEDIRKKVGSDFPVTARISSRDGYYGGRDLLDSLELCQYLKELGIDGLNISSGMYGDHVNYDIDNYKHGFVVPYAEEIKQLVNNIPVIATNRITTAGVAETIIKMGKADFVGMGRTSLADPYFPEKIKNGEEASVRHCINCNLGCYGGVLGPIGCVTCLVNPSVGKEYELDYTKTENPKKIFIAGGGPGGMQAAITVAQKGHNVTLFEEREQLGGQFLSAAYPPGKGELTLFTSWLIQEIKKLDIKVQLSTKLTKEIVERENPDTVIVATGGTPTIPPIKGIDKAHVFTAEDVLLGKVPTGANVVVCGGGEVGVETAAFVAQKENGKVTVVEMLPNVFPDLSFKKLFHEYSIDVKVSTKVAEIGDNKVIVDNGTTQTSIKADTVILAFGYRPNNILKEEIKDACTDVRVIGGALKTSNALYATREAFEEAITIN